MERRGELLERAEDPERLKGRAISHTVHRAYRFPFLSPLGHPSTNFQTRTAVWCLPYLLIPPTHVLRATTTR